MSHSRNEVGLHCRANPQIPSGNFSMSLVSRIKRFLLSDDGTTAVEYAVLLAMILVAIVFGVTSAGGGVSSWWNNIKVKVSSY